MAAFWIIHEGTESWNSELVDGGTKQIIIKKLLEPYTALLIPFSIAFLSALKAVGKYPVLKEKKIFLYILVRFHVPVRLMDRR